MADLIKNVFNRDSLNEIALAIKSVYSPFQIDAFLASTMDSTWDGLELKARVRKISLALGEHLPEDYGDALAILEKALTDFPKNNILAFFFPDFVEVYGQDEAHWDLSIGALERTTEYWSAEFAVRPFIIKHEERMMAQMRAWSKHENEHVRRLASEGCRPALPWGQALAKYKKDPAPILPILEQLKADPSAYVRKSVANNLNDISKTHPDLVMEIARDWYGKDEGTDWIVKHGCRTLLKKGNPDALALFGYQETSHINVDGFALGEASISIGDELTFSFAVSTTEAAKIRLEYGVDYVKASGKSSRKIFQISEVSLKENEKKLYTKRHSFADVSVRKHYPGVHTITLIVNGLERGALDFELDNGKA